MKIKKPQLGQKVFVFDYDLECLYRDKVVMKGLDSFAVSMAFSESYDPDDYGEKPTFERPIRYDNYGNVWFTALNDAKEYLESYYPGEKLVYSGENCWELLYEGGKK